MLAGMRCKINLIPYNAIGDADLRPPGENQIDAFQQVLLDKYFTVIIRRSRGTEIAAACGQLASGAVRPVLNET